MVEHSVTQPQTAAPTLDQSLWRDLTGARDDATFGQAWLGLACRMIAGATSGVLLLGDGACVARWPAELPPDPTLIAVARLAAEGRNGVVQQPQDEPTRIAYPVLLGDRLAASAGIAVHASPSADLRACMRQLQWASAWVRDHLRRKEAATQALAAERSALALDLLAAALEEPGFAAACRIAATELAERLGCERVSIGFRRGGASEVAAVSHSASFGKRMNLVRLLAEAMDEAIDQNAVILSPAPPDSPLAMRAHMALAAAHGSSLALTVPLFVKDAFVGAVVFERPADRPFDQPSVDVAEALAAILGPALLDKREIDRWIGLKLLDSVRREFARVAGPGHAKRKLALAGAVVAGLAAQFSVGTYRVPGHGRVEGAVQRSITAPFDGFVREAPVKAGAVVRAGDPLAVFDDRDLVLERLRWVAERQQHVVEYGEALGKEQRADALRFTNLREQAEAQIRLVDEQLSRARVVAPFDGLVLSGDLSQSIGAPVRRGDTLFDLAPLDDYRVVLDVDESQIADVAPRQRGSIMTAALPGRAFAFTVERVTPIATAQDGRMVFHVDARLEETSDRLRPGMEGVGKIDAGRRRTVWIWFRSLFRWAELATWKWQP